MVNRLLAQATPENWRLLVANLRRYTEARDWHGVMDMSAELRELEAVNPALKDLDE